MRVKFSLRRIEDMRDSQFDDALAEIHQLEENLKAYFRFRREQSQFVTQEIISAGTPWTADIARKWKARLQEMVPERPDWLEMKRQLEG